MMCAGDTCKATDKAVSAVNASLRGLRAWLHIYIPISSDAAEFFNGNDISNYNGKLGGTLPVGAVSACSAIAVACECEGATSCGWLCASF
jgi:hypothetical protein